MRLILIKFILLAFGGVLYEGAVAAESADIVVRGKIIPPACSISVSGNGVFDYGDIKFSSLNEDRPTLLPLKIAQLSVKCHAPTSVAIYGSDGKVGTSLEAPAGFVNFEEFGEIEANRLYGLGLSGGKPIGGYAIGVRGGMVDGAVAKFATRMTPGDTWRGAESGKPVNFNEYKFIGWYPAGFSSDQPSKYLMTQLLVKAMVAPAKELNVVGEVRLDGVAALTLHYF